MQAQSRILEPWYQFRMELPKDRVGRAMADLENRSASFDAPDLEGDTAVLTGLAPASEMQAYQKTFSAYAGGNGRLSLSPGGYLPCHDEQKVRMESAYDPDRDMEYPSGSIFCVHGAGEYVPWDEVPRKMHLPSFLKQNRDPQQMEREALEARRRQAAGNADTAEEELMEIFRRAHTSANQKEKRRGRDRTLASEKRKRTYQQEAPAEKAFSAGSRKEKSTEPLETVLLVDGYNLIYSRDDLKELASENMDSARGVLNDLLCSVQGYYGLETIVVYDAYRVPDHQTEILRDRNIHVVFTKEAETADQYIDKTAIALRGKKQAVVATSDKVEQVIAAGQDARILTAERFFELTEEMNREIHSEYLDKQEDMKHYLFDDVEKDVADKLGLIRRDEEEKHGKKE